MSTSLVFDSSKTEQTISLRILADKGTKGAYLDGISSVLKEREFLLAHDTKLRILEVSKSDIIGEQKIYIDCIITE